MNVIMGFISRLENNVICKDFENNGIGYEIKDCVL